MPGGAEDSDSCNRWNQKADLVFADDNRSCSPVFSRDGTNVAYAARNGNRWFLVVNGEKSAPFDYVFGQPTLSADGSKVAFGARSGNELWRKVWTLP